MNLSTLAEAEIARLREADPDREVEVYIRPDIVMDGDRRLLGIVFDNLLDNAWKFTAKTAQPYIEFGVTEREGEAACFVTDNGAGFDM